MRKSSKKTEFISDKVEFENWLMNNCGFSKKAARDCYYRCNRVEKILLVDLAESVRNEANFKKMVMEIKNYSKSNACNNKSIWVLSATLKSAVNKYASFKNKNSCTVA